MGMRMRMHAVTTPPQGSYWPGSIGKKMATRSYHDKNKNWTRCYFTVESLNELVQSFKWYPTETEKKRNQPVKDSTLMRSLSSLESALKLILPVTFCQDINSQGK